MRFWRKRRAERRRERRIAAMVVALCKANRLAEGVRRHVEWERAHRAGTSPGYVDLAKLWQEMDARWDPGP